MDGERMQKKEEEPERQIAELPPGYKRKAGNGTRFLYVGSFTGNTSCEQYLCGSISFPT